MAATIRFRVVRVEPEGDGDTVHVSLMAISHEDNSLFFTGSPAGVISLSGVTKEASTQFKMDTEVSVTLSEAE